MKLGVSTWADNLPLHTLAPAARASLKARAAGAWHREGLRVAHPADRHRHRQAKAPARGADDASEETPGQAGEGADHPGDRENHDLFTAAALAQIVRTIDRPFVGICLDTSNSFGALEDPDRVMDVIGPLAVNVHLKNSVVRLPQTDLGFIVEGVEPGTGRLDIPGLVKKLRGFGHDPNVIIEQWVPPDADIEDTVAKEQAWAERGFRRLRQLIPD